MGERGKKIVEESHAETVRESEQERERTEKKWTETNKKKKK